MNLDIKKKGNLKRKGSLSSIHKENPLKISIKKNKKNDSTLLNPQILRKKIKAGFQVTRFNGAKIRT